MSASDTPSTLSELRTVMINMLKEVSGVTAINTIARAYHDKTGFHATSDTTIGNIVLTVAGVATPIPIPVAARTGPRVRRGPSRTRMTSPATAPAARIATRNP